MKRLLARLQRLLHLPGWLLLLLTGLMLAAPWIVRQAGKRSMLAGLIYSAAAYCLLVFVWALPEGVRKGKRMALQNPFIQGIAQSRFVRQYRQDPAFRGSVSLYQGMALNFLNVLFRGVVGLRYASIWFLSLTAYYLMLGGIRLLLLRIRPGSSPAQELRCYRRTAWLLLALNLPMGGMIVQMVVTNSGFSYPGYVIYLSAIYAFYAMIHAVVQLVKYRKLGSPLHSAGKVVSFVSALMSILGLQTAMIAQFGSGDETMRRTMNALTGGAVWSMVVVAAVVMLVKSGKQKREEMIA